MVAFILYYVPTCMSYTYTENWMHKNRKRIELHTYSRSAAAATAADVACLHYYNKYLSLPLKESERWRKQERTSTTHVNQQRPPELNYNCWESLNQTPQSYRGWFGSLG